MEGGISEFRGVSFEVGNAMATNNSTTLCLLYKDASGGFSIPDESKIRMRTSSTQRYISIDDGDLDPT